MERLSVVLRAISRSLEPSRSLDETIGDIGEALTRCIGTATVEIHLAEQAPSHASGVLTVPLRIDGATIGAIAVRGPQRPDAAAIDMLHLLAGTIASAIACRLHRADRDLLRQNARTDAVTRIPNRLAFDERIAATWRRCRDRRIPLSIALVDIDFFKLYNDEYGHVAGDCCLQRVAALIAGLCATEDGFGARYGGEEFAVIFEGLELAETVLHAQRVVDRLAERWIEHAGTTLGRVSLSVGIASLIPPAEGEAVELIREADRALYRAKRLGRNRICAGPFASKGPIVARRSGAPGSTIRIEGEVFGRDADLARTFAALRHAQLVSIVGPPGIGKSRLVQLAAKAACAQFDDRSRLFCELDWLDADTNLAIGIAAELGLAVDCGGELETLTDFLNQRNTLMLLDNGARAVEPVRCLCEHLIAHAPGLSLVVATRNRLGIPDERSIVVPPLTEGAALALLRASLERLGSMYRGDDRLLAGIVHRLGGNPGAIEAAASQLARIGPRAMLARLEIAEYC